MENIIDKYFVKDKKTNESFLAEVMYDTQPTNPRKYHLENNSGVKIHFLTRKYSYSDFADNGGVDMTTEDLYEFGNSILNEYNGNKNYEILPIYMLDHGSRTLSFNDFNDPFDSGKAGFAVLDKSIPDIKKEAEKELKEFNDYIEGNVLMIDFFNGRNRDENQLYGDIFPKGRSIEEIIKELCVSSENKLEDIVVEKEQRNEKNMTKQECYTFANNYFSRSGFMTTDKALLNLFAEAIMRFDSSEIADAFKNNALDEYTKELRDGVIISKDDEYAVIKAYMSPRDFLSYYGGGTGDGLDVFYAETFERDLGGIVCAYVHHKKIDAEEQEM